MMENLAAICLVIGALFVFLAGIGLVRYPDVFMRMQATTKASTLGIGAVMVGVAAHFGISEVTVRSLLIVGFVFLTSPIAAHMIARAAYLSGAAKWIHTLADEMPLLSDDPPFEDDEVVESTP